MPKKRRITDDQARFLAISLINRVVSTQINVHPGQQGLDPLAWEFLAIQQKLPEKWMDGQTSDQSWDHVWLETMSQLIKIMICLAEEADNIHAQNPEFRHVV